MSLTMYSIYITILLLYTITARIIIIHIYSTYIYCLYIYYMYVCVYACVCTCAWVCEAVCLSLCRGYACDCNAARETSLRLCSSVSSWDKKENRFDKDYWGVGILGKLPDWKWNHILPRQLFDQIIFQNLKIIKTNHPNNFRKTKKKRKSHFSPLNIYTTYTTTVFL